MHPVSLAPRPGFCVKSATLSSGIIYLGTHPNPNLLEAPAAVPVPPHRKVFVNIAWDPNVPPPPEGSEDAIQNAMQGQDQIDEHNNPDGWYVPVIVSNPREDLDKAGNPSVVFDCVFHTSIKSRTLRDPEFKIFIVELSLQRIEAQTGLDLSRSISTPNIASKGKLLPRTVQIPASMLSASSKSEQNVNSTSELSPITTKNSSKTPLIQELSSESQPPDKPKRKNEDTSNSLPGLRGILKSPSITTSPAIPSANPVNDDEPLFWTWSNVDGGTSSDSKSKSGRIKLQVHITNLTVPMIASSTLHVSPRTLELVIPGRRPLIIDLSISDAEIAVRTGASYSASDAEIDEWKTRQQEVTTAVLKLKRERDFDVDGAEAEWKIGSGIVEIYL